MQPSHKLAFPYNLVEQMVRPSLEDMHDQLRHNQNRRIKVQFRGGNTTEAIVSEVKDDHVALDAPTGMMFVPLSDVRFFRVVQ